MKQRAALVIALALVAATYPFVRAAVPSVASGAWSDAANMISPRAGASATLLSDGRVLIAGGVDANGVLSSVEQFSTDGSSFMPLAPMEVPRANHTATLLRDGSVLVTGGTGADGHALASAEIYDTQSNTWQPASPLHVARRGHTATLLPDGTVLIAAGDDAGATSASLERFDPVSRTSTLLSASLSAPRTLHAAVLLADGRVFIVGGFDGMGALASAELIDAVAGSVTPAANLSVARSGLSATTLLDGRVLVIGGTSGGAELASAETYDPASNTFVPTDTPLAAGRQNHLALLLPHNNQVLVIGGSSSGNPVSQAELFTPWEGLNGTFCAVEICASGYAGPAAPKVARVWATGAALSFPADFWRRSGPYDGLLLLAGGVGQRSAELYGFATVRTDKEDYAPGQTVTITGSGWQPGESVALVLREYPLLDEHPLLDVTADANGNIVSTEFVPDEHDIGIRFYLTAFGTVSQAQTTFRDGNAKVSGRVTISGTSTGISGATVACTLGCSGSTTTNATGNYPISGNFNVSFPGNGPATFELTASASGYTSSTQSVTVPSNNIDITLNFSLTPADTTPPTVSSITRVTSTPTNATSVQWAVTFSESVTGVDATDFQLAPTAVTSASITGVSGSAASYTVTANTGNGSGSLGLNLVDNDTIVDSGNNKLGGTGVSNGNFTGDVYVIDKTGPTVTVNQAALQTDPTNASPINFTAVFNEAVTDFATGDVVLSGAGATTATITGSGTTYNIAVSGMTITGTVTVTIPAGAVHDSLNNPSTASTGDNSVLYDATAPTSVIALGPAAPNGANGWYTTNVHVTVSAADDAGGSGVTETRCVIDPVSPPASFAAIPAGCAYTGVGLDVTAEGTHAIYAASRDNATNVETPVKVRSFKLDKTGPSAALSVTAGTLGSNGWYTSDVTVHTAGADSVSGGVACSADQVQTTETAGTPFNGSCTNDAGLTTNAAPLTVKLDKTAPTGVALAVVSGTLGANGWYTTDVTVQTTGAETISGPVNCTANQTVATETTGQSLNGSCTNEAGLSADAAAITIKLDKTGPTTSLAVNVGTPGSNGWYTSDVTVHTSGDDAISGVTSCTADQLQTSETVGTQFNGSCTNGAGLSTNASPLTVKLDKTAPSATQTVIEGTLGANGWYTSDVTVHAEGNDSISAPVVCTPNQVQTAETTGTAFNASCTNDAGLSTNAAPLTIKLDKTGPSATLAVSAGTLGANGWYTSDVTVSASGVDTISSPVSCTGDQFQTSETAGTNFNGSCTNDAGLSTNAAALMVKLDKSAPTGVASAVIAGTAGTNGWYVSDVSVQTTGSEDISGPASCTADQSITTETAGLPVSGSCTNQAGLTANAPVLTIKLDKTGPSATLAVSAGTSGANGWYTSNVTVSTTGADTISSPVTCTADQYQTSETAGTNFNGSCTNDAGLSTNAAALLVKLDKTAPTGVASSVIAGTAGTNGWYVSDVSVQTTGSEDISGPASCTVDQSITTETAGLPVSGSCTNQAGLTANAPVLTIKLDKTGPSATLAVSAGTAGANGWYTSNVTVSTTGADTISSPVSCTGDQFQTSETASTNFNGSCTNDAGLSTNAAALLVKLDKTAPTGVASAVIAGTAGTHGWYVSDVSVQTTGSEDISGPASCTADQSITTETAGLPVNGSCTNQAGLTANAPVLTIKLDKTGPSAALAVSAGTLGANGWYTSDVTVSASGVDTISSPVSCTGDQFQTSETASTNFNGSCTNDAGLSTNAAALLVKLDKTAPTGVASAVIAGTAGTHGWYVSDVSVQTTGSEDISGPASCSVNQTITTETAGQAVNGSCTNQAGLTANAPVLTIKLDKTGPSATLAVSAGTPGANGWYTSNVTVSATGSDSIASPVSCTGNQSQTTETTGAIFNGSCTNDAGLSTNAAPLTVKLDKTGPTAALAMTGTLGTNGWFTSNVTISASGGDTISGPASCTSNQYQTDDTTGTAFAGSCTNQAGLTTNAAPVTVKRDATPPVVNPSVAPNPVMLNGVATASGGQSDATSGIASYSCGALVTSSVGMKSVTCQATDNAGNSRSASTNYSVVYASSTGSCLGTPGHQILQPIDADGMSVFKQKSTVPAKFRVCDANGNSIGTAGVVSSFYEILEAPGTSYPNANEVVDSTTPDTVFRWSPTDQQWIFNINTKGMSVNKTYLFRISLNDGTFIDFRFGLK